MSKRTHPSSFDPGGDGIDYALIAIGVGVAVISLIYLMVT
jgi:hypothetical protein